MREITIQDGIITVPIPREYRLSYLSEIARVQFTKWLDGDTGIIDINGMDTYKVESILRCLDNIKYSSKFGVKLSDSFVQYFLDTINKNKARREKEYEERLKNAELHRAFAKVKNGCGFCEYLQKIKYGHKCVVTGENCLQKIDEQEMSMCTLKDEGVYETPTPYPSKNCPYRKYLEEIKNGRKEEQSVAL